MTEKRLLLADVCMEYFGITEQMAARRAASGTFPIPVFRLGRKTPWYIQQSDFDRHVEAQIALAMPEKIQERKEQKKLEPPKPTSLYRHFDEKGLLLYVGISLSVFARLIQHRNGSHWADEICRIDVQRYPSWEAAYEAETEAIQKEKPMHNKAKTPKAIQEQMEA